MEVTQLQLDREHLKFIQESRQLLVGQMAMPEVMQEELDRRAGENELMQLKILMLFYRRIQPLSELELRENSQGGVAGR